MSLSSQLSTSSSIPTILGDLGRLNIEAQSVDSERLDSVSPVSIDEILHSNPQDDLRINLSPLSFLNDIDDELSIENTETQQNVEPAFLDTDIVVNSDSALTTRSILFKIFVRKAFQNASCRQNIIDSQLSRKAIMLQILDVFITANPDSRLMVLDRLGVREMDRNHAAELLSNHYPELMELPIE